MKTLLLAVLTVLLLPLCVSAQGIQEMPVETTFQARVVEIIEQNDIVREDGSISIQQKLKLIGLDGLWQNQEVIYDGTVYDDISANRYGVGDKVFMIHDNFSGEDHFYIADMVRTTPIYWLAALFALMVVVIGRWKGVRALIVLVLTFVVILKFILPQILAGSDPLAISLLGSLIILVAAIYITEGFRRRSTVAIVSVAIALVITGLLSIWFTGIIQLTGFASEESTLLIGLIGEAINIKGLLLAGIIIGALGVLDDVVIAQTALVEELRTANPKLSDAKLYQQAMRVGVSHLSSMINTLFLAYAGAALPLLLLFNIQVPPFVTFAEVISSEVVATEIVRAMTGSIGLVLSVPIATFLAVRFIRFQKTSKSS